MGILASFGLFAVTALAEIIGCYLPYLWLRKAGPAWLLLPAVLSLCVFVWLLTLHQMAAGRTYAAYGAIYIAMALLWLWRIDGITPDRWDIIGMMLAISGAAVILLAPRA